METTGPAENGKVSHHTLRCDRQFRLLCVTPDGILGSVLANKIFKPPDRGSGEGGSSGNMLNILAANDGGRRRGGLAQTFTKYQLALPHVLIPLCIAKRQTTQIYAPFATDYAVANLSSSIAHTIRP